MLKSFYFISVSTVFTAIFLLISSQLVELKSQTLRSDYTWEVGFDVLPIIADTSYHMRESILIKYKLNRNLKLRGRFGVNLFTANNTDDHPEFNSISDLDAFYPSFYLSGGIETLAFNSDKINIGIGSDLFFLFRREKFERKLSNFEFFVNNSAMRVGMNLILNGEYSILKNFAINIEAYWQFAYQRQIFFEEDYHFGNLARFVGATYKRFITQLQPISSVNLIYKF